MERVFHFNSRQKGYEYLIGSDALGRDGLSRLIYGAQVSLLVGFQCFIGGIIGTLLKIFYWYYGRLIDDIIMRLADIQLAFLLFYLQYFSGSGEGLINLILVLGVVNGWHMPE